MMVELNHVHRQRIREAVKAALSGHPVEFRIQGAEERQIAWLDKSVWPHRTRVISSASGSNAAQCLAAVREEYAAQYAAATMPPAA